MCHEVGSLCPKCERIEKELLAREFVDVIVVEKIGRVVEKTKQFGAYLGCSRFPHCKWTEATDKKKRERKQREKLHRLY